MTLSLLGGLLGSARAADPLAEGFARPPADARPLVFWQWVNGNVAQEGIRLDLEWMQRAGIAGAILFDVGFRTPPVPQYVSQRVGFGSPEWQAAIRFARAEARRLGLLLGAQSSGGWSLSGDPSVTPDHAMKKLVWSEMDVTADSPLPLHLPALPRNAGPYQDLPLESADAPVLGGDLAVIAFRLSEAEQEPLPRPVLRGLDRAELLEDGSFANGVEIPANAAGDLLLDAQLDRPPGALTLAARRGALPAFVVEFSADGSNYQAVDFPRVTVAQAAPVTTVALTGSAGYWRIRFAATSAPLVLTEARFDCGARLHHGPEKEGFGTLREYRGPAQPDDARARIDARNVIDLTGKMAADGTLNWRPTAGRWRVQRFGWSLTGRLTVPATPESIGLEVDKLDADAVRAFVANFYGRYSRAMGDSGSLDLAFTDSWEAGQQTYTPTLFGEFFDRRGYDLTPWLPVLTGRVVGDVARSERVLADFRRTISDLLIANHYGVINAFAHAQGWRYAAQAPGTDAPATLDGLRARGLTDMPTGEFWVWPEGAAPKPEHVADVREAASAAHLYGRRWVAAESLTSQGELPWAQGPAQWRRMVDRFFAEGVNRVILHTSVHQPFTDRWPGVTLRQYGQHFTRNETWAEEAGAWVDYLARSSWLLQQGRNVADVAVFIGENPAPLAAFPAPEDRALAAGLDYDFLNSHSLERLRVRNRRLELPSGASYALLTVHEGVALDATTRRRLQQLRRAGAVVVTPGRAGSNLAQGLRQAQVTPDLRTVCPDLHWRHRRLAEGDLYFLTNQSAQPCQDHIEFRARARAAEFWDATDGSRRPVPVESRGDLSALPVALPAKGSIFVVFRGQSTTSRVAATVERNLMTLDGPWEVDFLDGRGAPSHATLTGSWTQQSDAGIRFYSGRARYTRTFGVPADWLAREVVLDLGEVGDLARVRLNDQDLGVWWSPPLRREIRRALRPGENRLEITVTNYWANRLIGDEQPGATRYTFAPIRPYSADSPLRPAGLLGPVRLVGLTPPESP